MRHGAATRRDHEGWRELLAEAGAMDWSHAQTARWLVEEQGVEVRLPWVGPVRRSRSLSMARPATTRRLRVRVPATGGPDAGNAPVAGWLNLR